MTKVNTLEQQMRRMSYRKSGTFNRMVALCQGISYIQEKSPIKGAHRRHGERRLLNPDFSRFYFERNAELAERTARMLGSLNLNG